MKPSLKTHSIDGFNQTPGLLHAFSLRRYESAPGVFDDLLLGRLNDPRALSKHRQWLLDHLNISGGNIFLVKQVHGDRVFVLKEAAPSVEQVEQEEADALVTNLEETPVAVLTADCVPVILYDPQAGAVGVAHAGRKGTEKRIVSKTLGVMSGIYGTRPADVRMALGPAIGGCCYEVDEPCIDPFRNAYPGWERFVMPQSGGKFRLDLLAANEADACEAGILPHNIHRSNECTACHNDRWYSYRREGTTGRIVSLAMLRRREGT